MPDALPRVVAHQGELKAVIRVLDGRDPYDPAHRPHLRPADGRENQVVIVQEKRAATTPPTEQE